MAVSKKATTGKITAVTTKAATQKVAPAAKAPAAAKAAAGLAVTQPIAPVAKPAPVAAKPAPVAAKPASAKTISRGEHKAMVEQAAYYIAEKHGFSGDPQAHWSQAEAEITATLKARGLTVA